MSGQSMKLKDILPALRWQRKISANNSQAPECLFLNQGNIPLVLKFNSIVYQANNNKINPQIGQSFGDGWGCCSKYQTSHNEFPAIIRLPRRTPRHTRTEVILGPRGVPRFITSAKMGSTTFWEKPIYNFCWIGPSVSSRIQFVI